MHGVVFLTMYCAENGVPVLCWFKNECTKGAVRLSHDRKNLILFDWKFPIVRKKKKFGTLTAPPRLSAPCCDGTSSCTVTEDVLVDFRRVTIVEPGLPFDFKKKMFGAAPKPDLSICLKDGGTYVS